MGMMGKIKTLVVGLLTLSLIATILMTTLPGNVSASPSWQVGDKWALAGEKDISEIWDNLEPLLASSLNDSLGGAPFNLTLVSSSFHGVIMMDALFEVISVTSSNITLQIKIAANLTIAANVVVNTNVPEPGHYNSSSPQPAFVNKDVTASVKIAAGSSGTITVVTTSDTRGIESINTNMNNYLMGSISGTNFPNIVGNSSDFTLSYGPYANQIDLHALTQMHAVVSPALYVISETMVIGENRTANANITVGETISGSLDSTGIPDIVKEAYLTPEMANYGITGLPINLAKIYNPDPNNGIPINNGTIATRSGPIEANIAYLRNKNVDSAVNGTVSAREYGLQTGNSTDVFTFLIDPENGHALGTTSTIPMDQTQVIFTTHAVAVGSAQTNISAIDTQVSERQSYDTVTAPIGGGGTSGISSDLLIIIGAVLIVVVAALAGVMLMRRKK
jgi:hypothetical protein